jgi:hypothetical protein
MADCVRTATNVHVVMPPSPQEAVRTSWQIWHNNFPGAGLGTHRTHWQYHWCDGGTRNPTWTPQVMTVDGTDVFALFCHPSRSQVPI